MSEELQKLPANATVADLVTYEIARGNVTPETGLQMLKLRTEWEQREAEKEFVAAKARLQFPAIIRAKKSLNSKYAPLELIQEIIDPILRAEGFTLSFTSSEPNEKNWVKVTGRLSKGTYFQEAEIWQPASTVSKGMNANQAMGSANSYAQRYLIGMMLNLRFVGVDDDAQSMSYITDQECMAIEDLIAECSGGMGPKEKAEFLSKFLDWAEAKSVAEITRLKYWGAVKNLEMKRARIGSEPK